MSASAPPGFCRVEKQGQRVHYLTVPVDGQTPRKLNDRSQVASYLAKEGIQGVELEEFDFKLKRKTEPVRSAAEKQPRLSEVFDDDSNDEELEETSAVKNGGSRFNLKNLVRTGVKLDHRKLLEETASLLDDFRLRENEEEFEAARLAKLKIDLLNTSSLDDLASTVGSTPEGLKAMAVVVEEHCLQELLTLSSSEGPLPLSEWPNNTSENWFSEVVKFGVRQSPITLSLILRLAVKDLDTNVQPR